METITNLKNKIGLNKLYVVGHKITDVDSYISIELLSKLLLHFGINVIPALQIDYDMIDEYTKMIVEKYSDTKISKQDIKDNDFIFLVDHNNVFESVRSIAIDNVVGIIDHHLDEGIDIDFKIVKSCGSTTVLIYQLYNQLDISMDKRDKLKVLISLLIDTSFLMSNKAKAEDKKLALQLSEELDCDIQKLKEEYLLSTNVDRPVDVVAVNGLKELNINNVVIGCSYIEHFGDEKALIKVEDVKNFLEKTKHELFILITKDFTRGNTEVFSFGKLKDKVPYTKYNYIASRADTVIPMLRTYLK